MSHDSSIPDRLTATNEATPRFSWPMRLFLFALLFHMFFRSTDVLYPWEKWRDEIGIDMLVGRGRRRACMGYCNYLAHRHPHNERGSPLCEILLYTVTYKSLPPGEDPHTYYRYLIDNTRDHHSPLATPAFFVYRPSSREGSFIE